MRKDEAAFTTAGEFLDLFGVDRSKRGAKDFESLVYRGAVMERYPELHVNTYQVAMYDMSAGHISPLVYWSNMRRAIAPALQADRATLEALTGVRVAGEGEITAYALAAAVAASLARLSVEWYAELLAAHERGELDDAGMLDVVHACEKDREIAQGIADAIAAQLKRRKG